MKQFLRKILVFSIIILVVVIGFSAVFVVDTANKYIMDEDVAQVFMGDSHMQLTVNNNVQKGLNIAASSESYYFSLYKLKRLFAVNKNIDRVYLGFSYHNISGYYDDFISGEYSKSVSPKFFWSLPTYNKLEVLWWNRKSLSFFAQKTFKESMITLSKSNFEYFGYINSPTGQRAIKNRMDERIEFQYYKEGEVLSFSETNIDYLYEIRDLCKRHNVELKLMNTPLHPYYLSQVPNSYAVKYNDIVKDINLELIDLSAIELNDSCYIPDGDHLSYGGANILEATLIKITETE